MGLRTAYIRNNGLLNEVPSFTILSSRCVHLGCPVQPQGPISDEEKKTVKAKGGEVLLTPTQPSGFGCPCHGGAYNDEGERTAGPPVRVARPLSLRDHRGEPRAQDPVQRRRGRRQRRRRGDPLPTSSPTRASTSTAPSRSSTRSSTDGDEAQIQAAAAARGGAARARGLARGALGAGRRAQVLPLPEGSARDELVPHSRLGDADRVPRPGDYRRDPRDVLQAVARRGLRVDPARSRTTCSRAGSSAACTAGAPAS